MFGASYLNKLTAFRNKISEQHKLDLTGTVKWDIDTLYGRVVSSSQIQKSLEFDSLNLFIQPLRWLVQRRHMERLSFPHADDSDYQENAARQLKQTTASPAAGNQTGECQQHSDPGDNDLQRHSLGRMKPNL